MHSRGSNAGSGPTTTRAITPSSSVRSSRSRKASLGRASSTGSTATSPPEAIEAVVSAAGIADHFRATVSSEEVERGKPAPDVYLEAARRLEVEPVRCAAVEDSGNGIRAAHSAGMRVIAIPNPHYPPSDDALEVA